MTMKKLSAVFALALMSTTLVAISSTQASAAPTLTTCTNLETGKTLVLRSADAKCRSHMGSALWVEEKSDSPSRTGDGYATMTVCSSKNSLFTYQLIKDACPKFQVTTNYWRTVAAPATPVIEAASARGHDSAALFIKPTTSALSAPVLYYLVTDIGSGEVRRVAPVMPGYLNLSGLSSESTYTFTIAAVNVDGSSAASLATPLIRTGTAPVVSTNTPAVVAAPAFTISSSAETKTVNNAIVGYTINSSGGGTVASYSISPAAPAGLTFSTSTGLLSGTPTSVASATAYTITATNASGSATRTFTLTVTAIVYTVGDTGPGGGRIFYVAPVGTTFLCGPTRSATCTYLEAAPADISASITWAQPTYVGTAVNAPETATATAIGWGYMNTLAIISQGNTNTATSAAALADSHTVTVSSVVYNDWYLPSKDELRELCKFARSQLTGDPTVACNTSSEVTLLYDFANNVYWSSSEAAPDKAWSQSFLRYGSQNQGDKREGRRVRPIRAG
jgi:hypothetical protein